MSKIKEICIEYARNYGGGLPLTPEELCNATVLWVEKQIDNIPQPEPSEPLDVNTLANLIEGSETVIVDVNEAGTKLEVHLDSEVVAKIDRAILTPVSAVTEDSVPVVKPNREVTYVPKSSLGGAGGAGDLYKLSVEIYTDPTNPIGGVIDFYLVSTEDLTQLQGANMVTPQTLDKKLIGEHLSTLYDQSSLYTYLFILSLSANGFAQLYGITQDYSQGLSIVGGFDAVSITKVE